MIGAQPLFHRFRIVIGAPLHLGATAFVTDAGNARHLKAVVIAFTTAATGVAARNPRHHCRVIHLKADRRPDALTDFRQETIQRLGLHRGAREPVKDHALGTVRLSQAVAQNGDDDCVRHQIPRLHHCLGRTTRLGARRYSRAQ